MKLAATSGNIRLLSLVVATLALAFGCRGAPSAAFTELDEARRLTADLRIQFSKAADAANRAVMADTDEASVGFARDAQQTAGLVDRDAGALAPLLQNLRLQSEVQLLEQFKSRYAEYRKVDGSVLELAVENTNLKAQRLSFGPAREAADGFRDALASVVTASAAKDRCRIEALVSKAVLALREVQVWQAPHIAESDDAAMTRMEKEMARLNGTAADALTELSPLIEPNARPSLAAAQAALERFKSVAAQIVTLSRRNSNVRSLDLSLRAKPALTAACDESLRALQEALAKEGSQATR